jgi:DNA ligase-1
VKLKKDYIESMGDSFDLVPIGGWRGSGRKKRWISPFLVATYDKHEGTFGSVCRVMSGLPDDFYRRATLRYLGRLCAGGHVFGEAAAENALQAAEGQGGEAWEGLEAGAEPLDEEGEEEEEEEGAEEVRAAAVLEEESQGGGWLRSSPAHGVQTLERCEFWFEPREVWEIRAADITVSPVHLSALGLAHPDRGLSLRFPRFIRMRADKGVEQATGPDELHAAFLRQTQAR